jgi:hypothetical protein
MKSKWPMIVAAAGLLALTNGCLLFVAGAAAGAGVGTYAYVNGEIKGSESAPLDRTWDATLAAMKDLQFPIIKQSKDALQGQLTARNASDTKIEINVKMMSKSTTEIRIRVGTFGDESLSRLILEKIKSHV